MNEQLYDCACPEGCDDFTMPTFNFADCATAVKEEESEIVHLFLDTVVTNEQSGEKEFSNLPDSVSGAAVGWYGGAAKLIGIGDMAAPEKTQRVISGRRTKFGLKTYLLNFDIDDVTDENYEAVRKLNCGQEVGFAFATIGGRIYGSIIGTVVAADPIFERGEDTYVRYNIQLQWKAHCPPPMAADPEAE